MHQVKKQILFFLLSLFALDAWAQTDHWESIIVPGTEFNYLVPTSELPINWNTLGFNDAEWNKGASGIGYEMMTIKRLLLLDAFGNVIDEVTYDDAAPWPEEADGNGSFLQLNDLTADNNDPVNWSASAYFLEAPILATINPDSIELMVYPNPSNSVFKIAAPSEIKTIILYNLYGNPVFNMALSTVTYDLDLSNFANGTYLLKIEMNSKVLMHRIVKD